MTNPYEHQSIGSINQRMHDRAHDVAHTMIGTALTQHQVMSCEEIDDVDLQTALRDLMFECDCCGWWHSIDELHNDEGQEFQEECDECHDCCED